MLHEDLLNSLGELVSHELLWRALITNYDKLKSVFYVKAAVCDGAALIKYV
jgi:hypothetical protein